jgi:hypothetical protein
VSGIELIVRRFAVTSSPTEPSPRVAPRHEPAVLIGEVDRQPVDLQLTHIPDVLAAEALPTRWSNARNSASSKALDSDSIRWACSTGAKRFEAGAPTAVSASPA